jgi:hypothetical protein
MLLQRMIHAAFGQGPIQVLISANTTNMNLFTAAGSPNKAVRVILTIAAGVTVGATSAASYALNVGQFPAGSDITIDNYGQILGAGGAANGGAGGGAINAEYANQSVVIHNHPGANIYAGGGGGGKGGTGGTGGTGGQGYYQTWVNIGWSERYNDWCVSQVSGAIRRFRNGATVTGSNYARGAYVKKTGPEDLYGDDAGYVDHYVLQELQTTYTSGGAGGAGGAGGNGGRGPGYDGSNVAGATGSGGSSGAAGGTNAGQGGTGGTGGAGGVGGGWGSSGANGSTGNTGGTGFSGNYTGGGSGTAGVAGSAGGLAGFYLKKGTASVTLINNGAVAGRLG